MSDLVTWLKAQLDEDEAWARATCRPYPYADEGATLPDGGVHWRWVAGDHRETVVPDPVTMEFVEDSDRCWAVNLATVEKWPSTSRLDDGTVIRVRMMPRTYATEIVEMDPAAAGHIIRHDPARVLREVEAKRRLIDNVAASRAWSESPECPADQRLTYERLAQGMYDALRHLSGAYADRDGYREEWRP